MRKTLLSTMIALSAWMLPATASGQDWYMCQTDLSILPIESPRIENGTVHYLDHTGFETSRSLDNVFFVLPSEEAPAWEYQFSGAGTVVTLELTDQQRFPAMILSSDDPDRLRFLTVFDSTPRSVDLELVQEIRLGINPQSSLASTDSDLIRLINNDTITGFIESIGESVIIDSDDGIRSFELNQTTLVQLANDADFLPPRTETFLYLDQATRLWVADLVYNETESGSAKSLYFEWNTKITDRPPRSGPINIKFEPERFSGTSVEHQMIDIVPLSSITPHSITPTGDRLWTPDPVTIAPSIPNSGLGDIDFVSPARIRYTLPESAVQLASTAQLIAGPWSDCELRITAIDSRDQMTEVQTIHLTAENHSHELSVNLPKGTTGLILSVEPGFNGPIQDHVILRRPRILTERPFPSTHFE